MDGLELRCYVQCWDLSFGAMGVWQQFGMGLASPFFSAPWFLVKWGSSHPSHILYWTTYGGKTEDDTAQICKNCLQDKHQLKFTIQQMVLSSWPSAGHASRHASKLTSRSSCSQISPRFVARRGWRLALAPLPFDENLPLLQGFSILQGLTGGARDKGSLVIWLRQHVFLLLFVVGLFVVVVNSGDSRWLSAKHQPRKPILTSMLFTPLVSERRGTLASSCLYFIICKYNDTYIIYTYIYIKHCLYKTFYTHLLILLLIE